MKLPWKSGADAGDATADETTADTSASSAASTDDGAPAKKGAGATTPGKGRPTPKRREAQARRTGPVAPPPTTRAEARARRKAQKATLTKEERKQLRAERTRARTEQREKMMSGDERYMIARDRGPVRAYVRDLVDSRRNFAGLFMPFAVLLIVAMMVPNFAVYINLVMLLFVVFMVIDSVILGRMVNKRVRERFPESTDTGFKLGLYAFTRAMQLRMMRAPRPRVSVGDEV
ncbi:DUF3043 domain-containing protein [Gordonia iterans]|uniref:DUF3043 domain-containing protein n=1 Tax=Gordonia iterans TaxID=1004901 RepID=A0A2S0KH68_9ACTN|nr:DUF3043 domain-containing protein [Gordonia iterans]AVM01038.1 DUF3043 domain-containing protein [Gordonia iterans]